MAKIVFTAPKVRAFKCPDGKAQAFLWDSTAQGLGLRVTPSTKATPEPKRSYIFQGVFQGKTIRATIGTPQAWTLPQAQEKAREMQRHIDEGRDPREVKADKAAADVAQRDAGKRATATVQDAWDAYLAERKRHWSALHYRDHDRAAHAGGTPRKRLKGIVTVAGPLAHFMNMRLSDVDAATVQAWAEREGKARPTSTRLALRILKAFLRWAAAEPDYKDLADATAASGKKTREMTGTSKPKNDYIQREQLAAWFSNVKKIPNPIISAYLQCLLLTGARREELAELKWEDVNFQWFGMTLKDKVEGARAVPLTPYVAHLLSSLPRRNQWVFSSTTSASGRLTEPSIAHRQACAAAGLDGLTLHGLRRSFASLCEWLDIPGGISAQIQGHAPQGVREQNYIRRPLDLLRVHHEKIEAWMLEQAGIVFDAKAASGALRVV